MVTQQELIDSHKSGFGGSDAKMFAKIGRNGIESLSTTDIKRVLQVLGRYEAEPFSGNVYTDAGHQFEEWMRAQDATFGYVQEHRLDAPSKPSFKVFAHADFWSPQLNEVIECKFSQSTTGEVIDTYYLQLQWYYMLGAESVVLAHGHGDVFPFAVEGVEYVHIQRDEAAVMAMVNGLAELQTAIDNGYFNDIVQTGDVTALSVEVRDALATVVMATKEIKRHEKMLDDARTILCKAMEASGTLTIKGEGVTISYVSPTTKKTFDSKKAVKDFPQLADEKYYKLSNVKASVRVTVKGEEGEQ